ncbi:MAG TPA: asparagine synthase (glutamine-hydrolyzing), partial [Anaeromyxobacteraceae bacterium]|nr:asparagine synthase (glutamine-hydrolyzing) [Anaeromyxobacteraceae bacterium]
MCGVGGILNLASGRAPELLALERMAAVQRHRGPDGWGLYRDELCGLAHVRLSIIDLAAGAQPLSNESDTLWITFNGEIFNYMELRDELAARGHVFRTRSDTEVIVHAFEQWGDDCFQRFNGQWALALWDATHHRLTLSRDRLGVRPLHLCEHNNRLFFASEVKGIYAADSSIPREFDPIGLSEAFTFWSPVPPRTPFARIEELRPGTVRTYTEGGLVREFTYWEPRYPSDGERKGAFTGSLPDAASAVGDALTEATRLRMTRADVPVGSYLSGGLDSSLVAALAARATPRFCTFSLRFADAEYDETPWQHLMAERLGTEHHEVVVSRSDIAAAFPEVVWHTERPLLRSAPAPLSLLSRLVRETGIKVVLTGEGADEMFAGYDLFREAKVRRFWARQPRSSWRPLLLDRLYPYLARSPVAQRAITRRFFGRDLDRAAEPGFSHALRWESAAALQRLFAPALRERLRCVDVQADLLGTLPDAFSQWTSLAQDQYLEIRTLLSGYLLSSQGDRMLMAHSVEGRFPFLDREVVSLAETLPAAFKLRRLDEKHVLKRAARDLVPDAIAKRTKQPYRAPDALSFCGPSAPAWVGELFSEESIRAAGIFDPTMAGLLWRKCRAHGSAEQFSNHDNMAVIGVLSTQLLWTRLVRHAPELPRLAGGLV